MLRPERMIETPNSNGREGTVVWAPVKSLWYSIMLLVAVIAGPLTWSFEAAAVCGLLTAITLCVGHSVGLHRLLIHRSFECPKWLEYCLVYAGTLVGMGGPRRMTAMHEFRDWCQRQSECHPFYIHKSGWLMDYVWNLHSEFRLDHSPEFDPEPAIADDRFYRLLDRFWMLAQLPLAITLYAVGGVPWLVWGICVRVVLSLTGHWFVGYLAHNYGEITWAIDDASVQGHNVPGLGLITMGESWHNNHHAFPESARLGLTAWQLDPGWWFVSGLKRLGLVTRVTLPEDHPARPERTRTASNRAEFTRRDSLAVATPPGHRAGRDQTRHLAPTR